MKKIKSRSKLRKNPLFGDTESLQKYLSDSVGNFNVTIALHGCTLNEKVIVASFIPILLKFIRSVPKKDLALKVTEILEKEILDILGE